MLKNLTYLHCNFILRTTLKCSVFFGYVARSTFLYFFFPFLHSSLFIPLYVCSLIYCMYAVTFLSMSDECIVSQVVLYVMSCIMK